MGKERVLERGLELRALQITESEGARGIAKVCAIISFPSSQSTNSNHHIRNRKWISIGFKSTPSGSLWFRFQ